MFTYATNFLIAPGLKRVIVPNQCCYNGFETLHGFVYQVHTHVLGRSVWLDRMTGKRGRQQQQDRRHFYAHPQLVAWAAGGVPTAVTLDLDPAWKPSPVIGPMMSAAKGVDSTVWVVTHTGSDAADPGSGAASGQGLIATAVVQQLEQDMGEVLQSWGADTFSRPHMISPDPDGNIWVTDTALHQAIKFTAQGQKLLEIGQRFQSGSDAIHLCEPEQVAVANDGTVYIADGHCNARVVQYAANGTFEGEFKLAVGSVPHSLLLDECNDMLVVADSALAKVYRFSLHSSELTGHSWSAGCCETQATRAPAYSLAPSCFAQHSFSGAAPDMQRSGVGRVGPAFPTPQQAEAAAPRLNMADFLAAAKRLQDRLTLAVKVESEEQIADIRRLYRSQSLKALQDSSAMLTSLVARPLEQLLGDFVWCLSAKMRSRREGAMPALPYHRFAAGDSVLLVALDAKGSVPRGQDTASLEATVFRVTQNQVHVAVGPWNSDIMEAAGPDRLWRMDRLSQEVTTKRQLAAIDQLDIPPCITREAALNLDPQDMASLWRGNLGIRMILAGSPEAAARAKHLPAWARSQLWRRDAGEQLRDIKTLNASQRRAIATAIAGSLTLWQGPPGTGKTRTLLALIQVLVGTLNTPKRLEEMGAVLACGDTNAAVDNLVEGLLAAGIKVVRLGQPAKVRPSLWPATMEAQALLTPKGQLAEKMRAKSAKEMERYRQGGYLHESLDRDALEQVKSEAKGLLSRASKLIAEASRDVIESSEVVAATCTGSGDAQRLGGRRFKMVVIDEATQATEPSTLIPLVQGAECVVLAGDPNQLPPTVISQKALKMGLDRTLFDRLLDMGISANLLDTQYRMHPLIAELPSQLFYGGLLKSGISAADRPTPASSIWPNPACPVVLVECEGAGERRSSGINQTSAEEGGNSYNNEEEAKLALRALWSLSESGPLGSVAILTPYNGQVRLLNNLLKEAGNPVLQHVEISSVDGYQGREADVIVFSTVRNNPAGTLGFVSDARRLNVAITRAKHALVVVGSAQTLANDRNWRAWLSWMKARHAIVSADTLPLAPWDA
ncbi:hypothetical protein WJX72_006138 [[Myrmecia] bisecta]|uniref:Uncharacterized protein n=1 Tax=[Myrmecia] bisecta TaxID=41462 RepID=A0AAW1P6M8_9CHLO